ncbi:MAG: tetratricopeptide repeat protein [Bacteroidales bacterium]
MKSNRLRLVGLFVLMFALCNSSFAQRTISGVVYKEGKPMAGVNVEIHKGGASMTSFDGAYSLEASDKSKYIKFTFIDDSKKLEIEGKAGDHFDFYWDGVAPKITTDEHGVDLRRHKELVEEKVTDYMNNVSLYSEYMKKDNYTDGLKPLLYIYEKYPASSKNVYVYYINYMKSKIKSAKSIEDKFRIVDTIFSIYEKRGEYFEDEKLDMASNKMAIFFHEVASDPNLDDDAIVKANKKLSTLAEDAISKGQITAGAVLLYMSATRTLYDFGKLTKQDVIDVYDKTSSIVDKELKAKPNDEDWKQAQATINNLFIKVADCETLMDIYTKQYETIKTDAEELNKMLRRLQYKECTESDLFKKATIQQYKLSPSAEAACNMAVNYWKENDKDNADKFFNEALSQETDPNQLCTYKFRYARFLFAEKKLSKAFGLLNEVVSSDAHNGDAYSLMGDIVASLNCGSEVYEKKAKYWVAVDYYAMAKKANPDLASQMDNKIGTYSRHYPTKEELFFANLKDGDSYTYSCGGVSRTTRVRSK